MADYKSLLLPLIEVTAMPLLVVSVIYVLSGYQIVTPDLHVFQNPWIIHADKVLRVLGLLLGSIHGTAGLILMLERRMRRRLLRLTLQYATLITGSGLASFLLTISILS
ncbi:hypothetical protein [Caldivirga sp.]|uniref:hypothetical protein n=1 Tax=Caldivirga sp. TaxID=2080243 RepID=UPI003D0F4D70